MRVSTFLIKAATKVSAPIKTVVAWLTGQSLFFKIIVGFLGFGSSCFGIYDYFYGDRTIEPIFMGDFIEPIFMGDFDEDYEPMEISDLSFVDKKITFYLWHSDSSNDGASNIDVTVFQYKNRGLTEVFQEKLNFIKEDGSVYFESLPTHLIGTVATCVHNNEDKYFKIGMWLTQENIEASSYININYRQAGQEFVFQDTEIDSCADGVNKIANGLDREIEASEKRISALQNKLEEEHKQEVARKISVMSLMIIGGNFQSYIYTDSSKTTSRTDFSLFVSRRNEWIELNKQTFQYIDGSVTATAIASTQPRAVISCLHNHGDKYFLMDKWAAPYGGGGYRKDMPSVVLFEPDFSSCSEGVEHINKTTTADSN